MHSFFTSAPFMPHGHCYLWNPNLVGLHIISDSLIALAYYSIPLALVYFVQKRRDLPFDWIFLLFGAFIVLCGTTHIMEVWTLWHPSYWLSGLLKAVTAGVSVMCAIALYPLIPRALKLPSPAQLETEIATRIAIEEKLRKSQQMMWLVMDNIPQLIFWKDRNSAYLGCNVAFAKVAGIDNPENIVGKTDYDLPWKSEETEFFLQCDRRVMETGIAEYNIIEPILKADGQPAWFETNKIPLYDEEGNVVGILGTVEDVTHRSRSEEELRESRERFELAVQGSRDGVWDWNLQSNEIYFSPRCNSMLGYEQGELQNTLQEWEKRLHPDDRDRVCATIQTFWKSREPHYEIEHRFLHKDGSYRWILVRGVALRDADGKPYRMAGSYTDITERKKAEEALRNSEAELRALFAAMNDVILVLDAEGCYLKIAPTNPELLCKPPAELIGKTLYEVFEPERAEFFHSCIRRALQIKKPLDIEYSLLIGDTEVWFATCISPMPENSVIWVARDISDRKQAMVDLKHAKDELEKSYNLLNAVVEGTPDPIFVKDIQGRYLTINYAGACAIGKTVEEIIGKDNSELFSPDVAHFLTLNDRCVLAKGDTEIFEEVIYTIKAGKATSPRTYLSTKSVYRDTEGNVIGLVGIARDITVAKEAQEALQKSKEKLEIRVEERTAALKRAVEQLQGEIVERQCAQEALRTANQTLQTLIQASPLAIVTIDTEGNVTMWNPAAERLFGWSDREVLGRSLPFIPVDKQQEFHALLQRTLRGEEKTGLELQRQKKDGSLIDVSLWTSPLFDENGAVISIIALFADISDRVRAEKALRESQQQLQAILDNSPAVIYLKDTQGRYIFVNRQWANLFHFDPDFVKGKKESELFSQEIAETFLKSDLLTLHNGTPLEVEEVLPINNQLRTYSSTKFGLFDWAGVPYAIGGISTDITDRKAAERALQESYNLVHSVIETIPDFVFVKNCRGQMAMLNSNLAEFLGKSVAEVLGKNDAELFPISLARKMRKKDLKIMKEGVAETFEEVAESAGGLARTFLTTKSPWRDREGNIIGLIGIARDISDRKRAEEILRESEEHFRATFEQAAVGISHCGLDGALIKVNQKFCDIVGYSQEELLGRSFRDITHPDDIIADLTQFRSLIRGEISTYSMEKRYVKKCGEIVWTNLTVALVRAAKGEPKYEVAVIQDISDRKRAEEELRQSEARYRELAQRETLLNQLAAQIRNSLELDSILETAVQEIRKLLLVDRCNFSWCRLQLEPPKWETVKECRESYLPTFVGEYPISATDPIVKQVANLEVIRIDDAQNSTDPVEQALYRAWGCSSMVILPIRTRLNDIGVFASVQQSARVWSDWEVKLLQAVASQLAIAIDQAELYRQSQIAAEIAQTKARQLELTLSELKQTQAQLIQSEKMSSLGQLVAGVAHEINNPVNFIYGNITYSNDYAGELLDLVELYQQFYPHPVREIQAKIDAIDLDFIKDDLPKILASMKVGADRIRSIVLSLRNFSRLDEADMKAVDIHEGIESALLILQSRLKAKLDRPSIAVIKEYGNLPLLECYAGQLNQVFMNILANAIDALEEKYRLSSIGHRAWESIPDFSSMPDIQCPLPTICIRTSVTENNCALIQFIDNGHGMTEEVSRKLFDPFFTTKAVGKGTGLGLSISYQIVEKHGGQLQCISAPGEGAEFAIAIPIVQLKQ